MKGNGHPRRLHGHRLVRPSRSSVADDQELVDARAETNYTAYVQDQSDQLLARTGQFVDGLQGRRRRAGQGALPRRARRTGSASRRSRSPSATSTRRWTPARPTSSPARSGPAGTGWRRTCGPRAPASTPPLRRSSAATYAEDLLANTRTLDGRIAGDDLHRRPDRQRLPRPARGGRQGQGHRRGGVLVAHRPVGLPGQRRRRPGGLRGRRAAAASRRTPALAETLDDPLRRSCRTCSTSSASADGFRSYDELSSEEIKALADAVNALSEPLSRLTAAVLS